MIQSPFFTLNHDTYLQMNANISSAVVISESKRRIGTTNNSVSGLYPFKEDSIAFESMLEKEFLIRLETFRSVLRVDSQPFTLKYTFSGKVRTYTPDFLVWFRNYPWPFRQPHLIEVKPNKFILNQVKQDSYRTKYKAAMQFCKNQGYVFHFQDEYRIKDQRWKNAKFLHRFKNFEEDSSLSNWMMESMESMRSSTVDYLLTKHFVTTYRRNLGLNHIWHLVASGRLDCDMDNCLSLNTELWMPPDD